MLLVQPPPLFQLAALLFTTPLLSPTFCQHKTSNTDRLTELRFYVQQQQQSHRFTASIQVNLHQPASPVKNWRFLLVQSFNAHMPLLTATSVFRLERRRWSSPQQCYLHYTVSVPKGFTFNQCQICYFRDVLPSRQSLSMVLKKLNQIRQKQTCISNKLYFNTK